MLIMLIVLLSFIVFIIQEFCTLLYIYVIDHRRVVEILRLTETLRLNFSNLKYLGLFLLNDIFENYFPLLPLV